MKSLIGICAGALLAITIGCAAKSSPRASSPASTAAEPVGMGAVPSEPRSEIDRLDREITDEMAKLALPRPTPPPLTCAGADCAQQMSGAATTATAPAPPACRPAQTQ